MDFFSFELTLLRLKEQLGVTTDKQVDELLGMEVSAFNKRKARGSFPESHLMRLLEQRPELGLDVTYVLTGERVGPKERTALDAMYVTTARTVGDVPEGSDVPAVVASASRAGRDQAQISASAGRCSNKRRQLMQMIESVDESGLDLLIRMAERLA